MVLREPSGQVGHNGSGISGAADHQRHHDGDQHAAAHRYDDDDAGIIRGRHPPRWGITELHQFMAPVTPGSFALLSSVRFAPLEIELLARGRHGAELRS